MKRFVAVISFLVLAAIAWFTVNSALARTDSPVTLSAGQMVRVVPNGCSLSVTKNTVDFVKVKCTASTSGAQALRQTASPDGTVTLNAGQQLKIQPNLCDLTVTKQTKLKVKVSCNPPTVKVGDGGTVYSPSQITIQAGETVHWTWVGSNHTVTGGTAPNADNLFCSPNDMNCGTANPSNSGATYDHTFNTAGTFQYFCQIHGSAMTGTVVVNP